MPYGPDKINEIVDAFNSLEPGEDIIHGNDITIKETPISNNNKESFDIDSDLPDMDNKNNTIPIRDKKKFEKKQKEVQELAQMSNLKDIDIEKSVLYLFMTTYSEEVIEVIT